MCPPRLHTTPRGTPGPFCITFIRWLALPSLPPAYSNACIRSTARGLACVISRDGPETKAAQTPRIPRRLRKKLQGSLR